MPAYDSAHRPPAPVAFVTVRSPDSGATVLDVPMLIDSGADVSLLPRDFVETLVDAAQATEQYEVEGFDGTRSVATAIRAELQFVSKLFRGQFLIVDGGQGILGRNVLNSVKILLDGPALRWSEQNKNQ